MYELEKKLYFYALVLVPAFLGLWVYNRYWRRRKQQEFGLSDKISYLSPDRSTFKPALKFGLSLFGIVLVIIALVNPKIGTTTEKVKTRGVDLVFAIDVSKSMLANDVAPNRLEKSKQIVS
jgi:Ca-activated chloride channel family protein